MSQRLKQHLPMLRFLSRAKPKAVKTVLKDAPKDLLCCLCECALNILKGNIKLTPVQKRALYRHRQKLRALVAKKTSSKKRKQILQKGGFIGALLKPVLGVLGGLLGGF